MFMLGLGELLEDWTHKKSIADLAGAMALNVDRAWVRGADGQELLVSVKDIHAGDCVVVRTGNMIPLDGRVTGGEAMVNQSSMTGESLPVRKTPGSYASVSYTHLDVYKRQVPCRVMGCRPEELHANRR